MPSPRFDTYYRYAELTELLQDYAKNCADYFRLQSIGKSFEGRDIWVATITNFSTGPDTEKPALWLDGNIHSAELASSSACLYLIYTLLENKTSDPDIMRCLDTRAFYICPRVNPDGAELALADKPTILRSSTRTYPFDTPLSDGLLTEDIDGDGRILSMRISDPDGNWKISDDEPRLMVPREATEHGGHYYRLLPEGSITNYDGITIKLQAKSQNLDLNRNFPSQWRGEHEQLGAGPFPGSEPEVQSLVQFISEHNNICSGIAFHCYSGVLLRPFSYQKDEQFIPEDLWLYQKIGAKGTSLTNYPAVSTYHDFQYHPNEVITGSLDDWLYESLGAVAWTVELWSPQRQAGISNYKFIDWYREHPFEDDLKLLKWNDEALKGEGYVDWYPFQHPQLGHIELGGWNTLYSFWNPPGHLLQQELTRLPQWLVWHNLISPKLELYEADSLQIDKNVWRVRMVVKNTGWLSSYVTKQALAKKKIRGVVFNIALPDKAELKSGKQHIELQQLEGRAHKSTSPFGWAGASSDPTDERVKMEWIVYAPESGIVELTAKHERAGVVRCAVELE
ncbi:MAG: carboxypeptidase [Gammaproteobacteria bacterium]|nr:carboxypeptidase [Gammaproteobacteria bacterium]